MRCDTHTHTHIHTMTVNWKINTRDTKEDKAGNHIVEAKLKKTQRKRKKLLKQGRN